jgi:Zn-dependent metalloprotease
VEFTANLVYSKQPGALNESFCDIFGVIIRNWDWTQLQTGGDVGAWNWRIGDALGSGGGPLRNMQSPQVTGDPDHMRDYLKTSTDNGGVHTNSNIHNKAAYNFLVASDQNGQALFTPREVALLYYLTLQRLSRTSDFQSTLATLVNVAGTYFAGRQNKAELLGAISGAYAAVGIT